MFKNAIKIAFRNLARNRIFTLVNIFGLAVGLATCLLIMLYIFDENSYDRHHNNVDRIFRIGSRIIGETWVAVPAPMAGGLKKEFPEVEQATRLLTFPDIEKLELKTVQNSVTKQFIELNGYYVDSNFFQVLTYRLDYGDPLTALNEPNSIVISEDISHKFFDSGNPLGKTIIVNTPLGLFNYTVKGVFDSHKYKSHIPANFFLSMNNNDMGNWVKGQTNWASNNIFFTYVKLRSGVDPRAFEAKLQPLLDRHAGEELKAAGVSKTLFLQPLTEIYLHSAAPNEIAANGNSKSLFILGSIALFILLIACINFMNLSTSRSQKRAKEVGVRKVLGAEQASLIRQFLGESLMLSMMALALALLLARAALPIFNELTQKNLHAFDRPELIWWIAGLTLFTGLLAGLYPAFYLSAFKPVSTLKGQLVNSFSATAIRKGLVVFQFTISICLVMAAMVIWQQLDFLKNQDLGFSKNQQIVLPLELGYRNTETNYIALKNELLKDPRVQHVSSGSTYPGIPNINDMLFFAAGASTHDALDVSLATVESDYIETLGFTLLSGRTFSKKITTDSAGIILNESAARKLGYTAYNAIGKKIKYDFAGMHNTLEVLGVVKDFHSESLHNEIKPFAFTTTFFANRYAYLIANVNTTDYGRLVADMGRIWKKAIPGSPFVYSFLDKDFQKNYEKDELTSRLVVDFTAIAILIACLGLLGLAAFSAEQRIKEIGIRKVLGASVLSVTSLLSKDFIRLVIGAIVIASPVAWFIMNKWLQNFAYRITISWWMFGVAGLLAVLVALATVSFQAVRAALANPVKSLRSE